MKNLILLLLCAVGVAAEGEKLKGTFKEYEDFICSSLMPRGWQYQRGLGENDDLFSDAMMNVGGDNYKCLADGVAGYWGYTGGVENACRNDNANKDIYLQSGRSSEKQTVEFRFCDNVAARLVVMKPPHAGHELLRGSLERWSDDSEGWVTVKNGKTFADQTGDPAKLKVESNDEQCSHRWRINDWRVENNQWLAGIDFKVEECETDPPVNHLANVNTTLHDKIDQLEKELLKKQDEFATRKVVADLAAQLEESDSKFEESKVALENTVSAASAEAERQAGIIESQKRELEAATEIRSELTSRLIKVEDQLANILGQVANLTAFQTTPINVERPGGGGDGGGCGSKCGVPSLAADGGDMTVRGDTVTFDSSDCTATVSDLCDVKQIVGAIIDKFNN